MARKRNTDCGISAAAESTRVETVCLSEVTPKNVSWLWPGRIPIGKITLWSGDPGLGKSLCTLDVAARITEGLPWPDGNGNAPSGSVIILTAEDDLEDTVVPRLIAADADLAKVRAVKSIVTLNPDGKKQAERCVDLLNDLERIRREIQGTARYRQEDCKLVVIDPLSAFVGNIDSYKSNEVRAMLAPLAAMAAETRVAILLVDHLNKASQPTKAMYRSMGSIAFVAAARSAWIFAKDKSNDARRLMLPIKNNLAPDSGGLAYSVVEHPSGHPVVEWEPNPIHISADVAVAPPQQQREAPETDATIAWLRSKLESGPVKSTEIDEAAAREGISEATLRRAKKQLNVKSRKAGFGKDGHWALSL